MPKKASARGEVPAPALKVASPSSSRGEVASSPSFRGEVASSPSSSAAGGAAAGGAAENPYGTPPPKTSPASPSSGGAWSTPSSKKGVTTTSELVPRVGCDRCKDHHLVKNSAPAGKRVAFASCSNPACPGGGIILFWSTECEFCARSIAEGTVSYSLDVGSGAHANAHFFNCLKDVIPGTEDSAVGVISAKIDIGGKCRPCHRRGDDADVIKDGDIVTKRKEPWHFSCARKSRKFYLQQIVVVQDERFAKYGAKLKKEEEKNASKRKAVSIDLLGSDSD